MGISIMNIKNLALALAISTSALSAFAAPVDDAGKDFYAQINGGYAFGMKSSGSSFTKTGKSFSAGLEAGARINEHFRLGLSFDYLPKFSAKIADDGVYSSTNAKVTSFAIMLNAFIDAGDFNGFRPYVVLGAGMSKNKTKDITVTDNSTGTTWTGGKSSKTNFAYKAGLGTKYAVTDDVDVDVRYQFVDLGKFQLTDNGRTMSGKLRANQIMVGVAYKF